jgi:hypothetical protein
MDIRKNPIGDCSERNPKKLFFVKHKAVSDGAFKSTPASLILYMPLYLPGVITL